MNWQYYEIFCAVADYGGVTAAARALQRPKSTLSVALRRLEEELGVRLIERSTRSMHLTEAGDSLYARMAPLFRQLGEAREEALATSRRVGGTLMIAAPYEFSAHHLGEVACRVMARHDDLQIRVEMHYDRINPLDERYDIVFSMTDHALPSSNIVARRVLSLQQGVFAAPSLLSAHEVPRKPDDLRSMPVLATSSDAQWTFTDTVGGSWQVPLHAPRLRSFNASIRLQAAIAGLGITRITTTYCEDAVRDGRLIQLLPEYNCASQVVYAMFTGRQLMPAKTRVFLDTLDDMT
tara:strand:- start:19915 stop:20793 length:879 start_codon:yes stop_codon:yes gene_type:complete